MFNSRNHCLTVVAVVFWAVAIGSAQAVVTCPSGDKAATGRVTGPYNFNYFGTIAQHAGNEPVAGTGSFVADGKGNITGGTFNMNCEGFEFNDAVTGGCYSINQDGTGFISLVFSGAPCFFGSNSKGVDLDIIVNSTASEISFASDAGDRNFFTGLEIPFSGVASH